MHAAQSRRRVFRAASLLTLTVVVIGILAEPPVDAQCFRSEPVAGFSQESIGGEVTGATRINQGLIEICSLSRGYGGTTDSLLGLLQDTSNEFSLAVDVVSIDGHGQAGVEARVFRGTGSDPAQAVVRISVVEDATGSGFAVESGVRALKSAQLESVKVPVMQVQLPIRIGVERSGDRITTYYVDGSRKRMDHLDVALASSPGLDVTRYRVGLVHGSDLSGERQPMVGVARFRNAVLERQQSVNPPRLSSFVDNYQGTIDQPTVLTIRGSRLGDTQEVTVAGLETTILLRTETAVSVEVPATGKPLRGDVVVRTPGGTTELPNAFFSFGKSFVRCDCNGDGVVDISDMAAMLNHLFLGGPPCVCDEAGDCNGDDNRDVSDPIRGLNFLFVDSRVPPPPPYPEPGTDPSVAMCGLEDQLPTLTGISTTEIQEGDVFSVFGSGFTATTRVVIPGARLEVVDRGPDTITLEAGVILGGGAPVAVMALEDFALPDATQCRPALCSSTAIGPVCTLGDPVELLPSVVPKFGASSQLDESGPIIMQLDRQAFDPTRPLEVTASLVSPAIANVTPGGRTTTFQMSPGSTFEDCVVALADRLRIELAGGGFLGEVSILPDRKSGRITVQRTETVPRSAAITGHISIYLGKIGRCGPNETHPINDEREHGWCRFGELVEPCGGLPRFEWFIPMHYVTSKSSSLASLPHPLGRSPHDKEIMFNWEAYCHVRRHRLWNLCTLESLVNAGRDEIPDFPVGAWVTKTLWRTEEELPDGMDPAKLYSYRYHGDGEIYYLTAIHHITKDIDRWFWYDLYPPVQILEGNKGEFVRGVGGCGGTDVDAPEWTTETVWDNYYLCTNVTRTQPVSTSGVGGVGPTATENSAWCGNFEFATECPDVIDAANLEPADDCFSGDDTCLNCHEVNGVANVAGTTLAVDFLHSLKSAVPEPFPCDGSTGPVTWVSHIESIVNNNCSCHSNWIGYDTLVDDPSGDVPWMKRVEPFDLENSYVWRKLTNTHAVLCDPPEDCGCAMPYDCSDTPTPLADWALNSIEEWILAGAPYD